MKICFCLESLGCGGAEKVAVELSESFVKFGHKVTILLISSPNIFYKVNKKVEIKSICASKKNNILNKIFLLRKEFKNNKPDVVISFFYHINLITSIAINRLKIAHIVSERNDPYHTKAKGILRMIRKTLFKTADGCVFQTPDAMHFYFKKESSKQTVIVNPVSIFSEPYLGENRNQTIVTVGRLTEQKNTILLIEAFKTVHNLFPDYELHIYGDGPLRNMLEKKASVLNSKILFLGSDPMWHEKERKASLFVLSSNYEGMPNALMEAMSLCIPVISTDCEIGGPRYLIKNKKNGILVEVNNKEMLSKEILNVLSNDVLRHNLSISNAHFAFDYSVDKISQKWIEFLEEIVNER